MPTWSATAFKGVDMTSNPEQLAPAVDKPGPMWLTVAENVRFNREGALFWRKGIEQKIDLGTDAKVDSLGANEQAMFAKSGTAVYYSTDEWATKTAVAALTRTASAREFFYPRKTEMYVMNATDGLTRIDASYAANAVSGIDGTCLSELEECLLVGDGDIIRYSAPSTEANPEFFYDFSGNGAGTKKMTSTVQALQNAAGIVMVVMKQGIDYAYGFDLDTGALLTRTLTRSHGGPNAWCVAYIENNTFVIFTGRRFLLVVADAGGVRIIDDPFRPRNAFDYPVRKFLDGIDTDQSLSFTEFDPATREYHGYVLKNGISYGLVANIDTGSWSIDIGKPYSCMTKWKNRVYAGDDSSDLIYLDNEGTRDNELAIRHRVVTPFFTLGDLTSDYLSVTYSGLLSAAGVYTQRFHTTGAGGTETLSENVSAEDTEDEDGLITKMLMSVGHSGTPIGQGQIGAETIGSGGSAPEGFSFKYPWEILTVGEKAQFEIESFDEGTALELRRLTVTAESSDLAYDSQ